MPTYDYTCDGCGAAVEYFQQISEAPKKKCPKCGESKLRRLIGAGAGFIFKGSGFYITDYRSEDYKARAKEETGASSSSAEKGESKNGDKAAGASKAESKSDAGKGGADAKSSEKPKKKDGRDKGKVASQSSS